ncbi:60S ribosomal protein L7 [Rhizoctonia solani AG-3 Rhs1AP]|uniref:60S ribosomal protein L7 n=1 Tax=Rhizoctonia solani AG-3 Rhs1AP TaxID=1086054 RepID=X8JEP2_9AGAM|nr:60S ribosomal protein L7 [Rhizoctonia solani AG-3 Rhs1AP]
MPPRPLSVTFDRPLSPIVQSLGEVLEDISDDRTQLTPAEQAWSSNQYYLESNGFILRPRLRQGWTPSWQEAGDDPSNYEDSIRITELGIADAIRASDGAQVVLKAVRSVPATTETTLGRPDELGILRRLHAPPYTGHVCNHAVPLLGSMPMPCTTEGSIAVLPLLRVHDDPPFVSVGEAVEFMKQVLRGLAFMHAQNVAHRDIKPSNIMMAGEVLYDEPFHPVAQSLSLDAKSILRPHARHELDSHRRHDGESAVRYYYINFSRASYLPPEATTDGKSKSRLLRCSRGQLGRFPEAMLTTGHDPFKADVYCLGKYVIDGLITRHLALAPFTSVARYMTRRDPRTRPTAAEVFAHFETIRGSLEAKCLGVPLDNKGHHIRPHLPIRSPRRTMSALNISNRPPSQYSWSSIDSARTLVEEISSPVMEVLKGHEPITRAVLKGSFGSSTPPPVPVSLPLPIQQERRPLERKRTKSKWGSLRSAILGVSR